jgi:hypothetical protein
MSKGKDIVSADNNQRFASELRKIVNDLARTIAVRHRIGARRAQDCAALNHNIFNILGSKANEIAAVHKTVKPAAKSINLNPKAGSFDDNASYDGIESRAIAPTRYNAYSFHPCLQRNNQSLN